MLCVLKETTTNTEWIVDCNTEEFSQLCSNHPDTGSHYLPLVVGYYGEPSCWYYFSFSVVPAWAKEKSENKA